MKRSMREWEESGGLEGDGIVVEWKVRVIYRDGKDGVGGDGARKDFSLRVSGIPTATAHGMGGEQKKLKGRG